MKSHNGNQIIEVAEVADPEPGMRISDLIKAATDAYYASKAVTEHWHFCAWDGVYRRADQIRALALRP